MSCSPRPAYNSRCRNSAVQQPSVQLLVRQHRTRIVTMTRAKWISLLGLLSFGAGFFLLGASRALSTVAEVTGGICGIALISLRLATLGGAATLSELR